MTNGAREKPKPLAALRANAILQTLTPAQLDSLASVCRPCYVERGEVIWRCGAEVDFFGLAVDGFVKMVRSCPTGAEVTLELMGPGQIFGLMGCITGTGCPLSAFAVTSLWVLHVPKQPFLDVFGQNIELKDVLLRRTALRLHGAVDLMARMSSGRVEERIAAILFILSESYGRREDGILRLDVPLTRQEIGEMAGTTVETTIRIMSRWQKEGMIMTDHQYIAIVDESRLSMVLAR